MIARRLLLGGGGSFPTPFTGVVDLAADPQGGWIWYCSPMAIHGVDHEVHFTYIRGDNAHIEARTVDETSGAVTAANDFRTMEDDDHANATLLRRASDDRIIAFYSAHNGSGEYHKISTNPDDVSAFGSEVNLDSTIGLASYTYTQPIQLTGETDDPIYLIFRESSTGVARWYWIKSTDNGATWGNLELILSQSGQSPYLKAIPNGTDRIDFVATQGNPTALATSVYHFYYTGGAFFESDGTGFTSPANASKMTLVYDGSSVRAALEDIGIGADGHPRLVFTRYVNVTTDHRYDYARWTGSAWVVNQMAAAGVGLDVATRYYSGGVAIDMVDANRVYASINDGSQFEMHLFVTSDGGSTWVDTALTESSSGKQIRPVAVRGAHSGGLRALWMDASVYNGFTDWSAGTRGVIS